LFRLLFGRPLVLLAAGIRAIPLFLPPEA
jgi:hypothetical protein